MPKEDANRDGGNGNPGGCQARCFASSRGATYVLAHNLGKDAQAFFGNCSGRQGGGRIAPYDLTKARIKFPRKITSLASRRPPPKIVSKLSRGSVFACEKFNPSIAERGSDEKNQRGEDLLRKINGRRRGDPAGSRKIRWRAEPPVRARPRKIISLACRSKWRTNLAAELKKSWNDATNRVRTFQEDSEQYVRENPTKASSPRSGSGSCSV